MNYFQTSTSPIKKGAETNELLENELQRLRDLFIEKNEQYNDSLQHPLSTFHKGDVVSGICARLDDKLGRIRESGINEHTIDTIDDLIGYLVHLRIALNKKVNK
jgi:hypothetical protein|tara:strand:+ start:1492 stop:1803 length:312 start_codon:yes stop_codon:yes gene_type:complete